MSRVKKRNSYQKGLSLIEILIGVVLSSLIMLALLTLYIAGQKYFFNQGAKADTIQDSSYPNEWIARDIRGASQVVYQHDSYTTTPSELILQVPSIMGNSEAIIDSSYDFIIYRQNPDNSNLLERIIDAAVGSSRTDSTRFIADDVSSIVFKFLNTNNGDISAISSQTDADNVFNIHFDITSTKTAIGRGGQPFQETFRSWAKIRSKAFE